MKNRILSILKDPNYSKCWYPCSGDDFEVTELWLKGLGNRIIPNLFILTDSELHRYNERNNTRERLESQGYELLDQITIDNMNVPMGQIDWRFNGIDWYNVSENEFIEIIQDGAFDTFIENQDKAELIELINFGIVSISQYVPAFLEMPNELKARMMGIINNHKEIIFASLYKKANKLLILIQCDNVDFFDYCQRHQIVIETAIVIRHELDSFLQRELLCIFKTLKTRSLIVYLNQCDEEQKTLFTRHQIGSHINYSSYTGLLNHSISDELIISEWQF